MIPPRKGWEELLEQAAAAGDVDPDSFMRFAWTAYLAAHPGMKEHLEEKQLRAQLEAMRKAGHIAQA